LRRVLPVLAFVLSAFSVSPVLADSVLVIVDLQMQKMHVRHNGETVHRWDVSSGRAGFETPPGRYQPTRMYRKYNSRTYDNAPMPYSIFYNGHFAIHGTNQVKKLGRPASSGCIRLHPKNAAKLFSLVQSEGLGNMRVVVVE
jgi:lipoprotein-anchoring transpeptidase ErfK/SrfK